MAGKLAVRLDVREVVVVTEDGHGPIARPQSPQRLDEPLFVELLRGVACEVACYGDEVGALLVDFIYYSMQALGLRPVVEVDVSELDHPVAVELGCQPGQPELHWPDLHPARLHLPRVEQPAQERGGRGHPRPLRVTTGHDLDLL